MQARLEAIKASPAAYKAMGGLQAYVDQCGLEKPLLETLKNGKAATFIVFQTPEEGIGIPVDLQGFADGFAALP